MENCLWVILKNKMCENVLILGCKRSGTSIFGKLFNHLSTHTYYSEIDFDLYLNKDFSKPIASKIPRENRKYQNNTKIKQTVLVDENVALGTAVAPGASIRCPLLIVSHQFQQAAWLHFFHLILTPKLNAARSSFSA